MGPSAVRCRALRCIAGLAAGCPAGQEAVAGASCRQQGQEVLLLQVGWPVLLPVHCQRAACLRWLQLCNVLTDKLCVGNATMCSPPSLLMHSFQPYSHAPATTFLPPTTAPVQAVLRSALYAQESAERSAARHVICAYCEANPEGQALLASTMMSGPGGGAYGQGYGQAGGASSFGEELVLALAMSGGQQGLQVGAWPCRVCRCLGSVRGGGGGGGAGGHERRAAGAAVCTGCMCVDCWRHVLVVLGLAMSGWCW